MKYNSWGQIIADQRFLYENPNKNFIMGDKNWSKLNKHGKRTQHDIRLIVSVYLYALCAAGFVVFKKLLFMNGSTLRSNWLSIKNLKETIMC